MFQTVRADRPGGPDDSDIDPIAGLGQCTATAWLQTASLDKVLRITAVD